MTKGHAPVALEADGPASPPRHNGELVFREPWESRAFGMAVALHRGGHFEWEEFRAALIEEIRSWEARHPDGEGWSYYACWLRALETLLEGKGLCESSRVDERSRRLAARPVGHDHLGS